jgi:predicted TPR repeat methyltransferase
MSTYDEAAGWYDRLYGQRRDYEADARVIHDIVSSRAPHARRLLDLACGTGGHLVHLHHAYDCTGLDLSAELIEVAASKLPDEVALHVADMTAFDLGERFDVITCLWSSIGYVATLPRLQDVATRMARHLTDGGIVVVEPWFRAESFDEQGTVSIVVSDDELPALSVTTTSRRGSVTDLRRVYVAATPDRVRTVEEHHVLGLFTRAEYLEAFEQAGFTAGWREDGLSDRGLIVAQLTETDREGSDEG